MKMMENHQSDSQDSPVLGSCLCIQEQYSRTDDPILDAINERVYDFVWSSMRVVGRNRHDDQ